MSALKLKQNFGLPKQKTPEEIKAMEDQFESNDKVEVTRPAEQLTSTATNAATIAPASEEKTDDDAAAKEELISNTYMIHRRQKDLLRDVAHKTKRSASELVRTAIDEYMNKLGWSHESE